MKAERWKHVNDLFQSAVERAPAERAAFLDEACRGDESLRREVGSLLTSHERSENFIELPAFEVAPELVTSERTNTLVGKLIGHYRIESLIGIGGMGDVYLARDERLGRKAALKLLPDSLTTDETQLSRFKNEARTASSLNHPNILTVYEIGAEGNRQFIATEFIEGITLRVSIARGRINPHTALEIAVQVASALAAAHEAGVVHRDIKPENIMLRPDGYVKVLDFGIAKLSEQRLASHDHTVETTAPLQTRPGLVLGTARYMSPEQARGQKVDVRTDIWSLGVVFYEMVGGIPPFRGDTPSDCIASILTAEPPPLSGILTDVPLKLESILQKALRKNSDERYHTIKEMLADLRLLKEELEADSSLPQTKAPAESIVSKIKHHKRGMLFTLAGALLAAAVVYSFYFVAPAPLPNEKSIAVLPFENLSEEKSNAYFADGIQEEILTRLSKIADLKVISRTSPQRYKSAPNNLREIADQLGVAHVLEGSVQKAADEVRVNVQLINAQSDSHLWADKFDRKLTDIFAVESEIAAKIADILQAKLTGAEQRAISSRPTENSEAHQLYLRGRFYWNKWLGPDFDKSRQYYQQAIELDPNYALAYAGLADFYGFAFAMGLLPPEEKWAKMEEDMAKKALELDPTLGEAYNPLAAAKLYFHRDWPAAEGDFRRGFELSPNFAEMHLHYALCLIFFDRNQEAFAEMRRALDLDPLSPRFGFGSARLFFFVRQYDAAIDQYRKTLELDPSWAFAHEWLGDAYEKKQMQKEAIAEWSKALHLSGVDEDASLLERTYAN